MASTSYTTPRRINYDVFLSFRGTDTRKTFVGHLYNKLVEAGIRTFKDDEELEKGQRIEELLQYIKESQFAIVVFSQDYASAKWCLEEIATIMECQQQYGEEIMIPIFYDVEPSVVRNQTQSFAESFKRHEEKENTEKLKRWKKALKDAGEISGYHLQNDFNGFEAKCVEIVTNDIFIRVNRCIQAFSTVLDNFVGLESRLTDVGKLLTQELDDVQFIGIWGMGGIGKTTIAMVVFNKFSSQFDGACFLDDVKQHKITELQETLLGRILNKKMGISNEVDGREKIQRWLRGKKVLIVLDDVDQVEQLEKLAGHPDWFGRGSRVIITTRDAGVLRSHGVDKMYVYEVHTLEHLKAIQLFSCYAFKSEIRATGFQRLSGLIVDYCKGLPLALKILGSSLCGLEAADWESTLEQLKDTPNDDIHGKLKISFDRLDPKNQKIFLHIACFFRHEEEKHVKEALQSWNLLPSLRALIEKSLISVEKGRIEMHDLIQGMGWDIARYEKPRSRVWEFKEVDDVLSGKMDPKHIEFMLFPYTCGFRWQNISNTFEALKILIGKRSWSYEERDNNYQLPSSLRWLHFPDYPFRSLPTSFHHSSMDTNPSELVGLCLHRSSLENCWITKELNKLTYLDLCSSGSLLKTPNFDMMPNLRSLNLSYCEKLKEIHPSVGRLEKLVLLDLSQCWQLQMLPCFVQLSSLQFLKLVHCSKLENFPEIQANMRLVLELNLDIIGIRELPSSIGRLRGLTKLSLYLCSNLLSLSDDLCELENLKILELRHCGQLESLPENLGNLSKLEELYIFATAIFQLPSSITQLSSLECLCWGSNVFDDETVLKFLPSVSGLRSLKKLQLSYFRIIDEGLPSDLGQCLISLEYLNLMGSKFDYLPECFVQLPHLQYLDLRNCEELEMLPELPKTIRELYMHSHFVSGNKSINIAMFAIKYPKLYSISFSSFLDYVYDSFRGETFLAKESIQFPFHRKTPFSVSYSSNKEFKEPMDDRYPFLRSFQYQRFKSNRICFNLNPYWYSTQFGGFAVYFVSYHDDMWEPRSYEGFDDDCTRHCVIKAKLSSHNDIHEDLKTKCVIAGSTYSDDRAICFVYVPFSSLWPESKPITEASDYSRFEVELVNLEASADWGINLLYKSRYTFPSLEGATEHMGNYHRSDSGHLAMDLDPDLEEFVGAGGKSSFGIDQSQSSKITLKRKSAPSDHHETDQLPIGPPPSSSSIAPVPSTSLGKRPLGEVEVETEVPGSTLATDREMPRLAEEGPPHVRALVRGTADLPKMFNLLSELGPPPASVVSDTNEEVAAKMAQHLSYVANTSTELFMRCQLYAMKRDEESQAFKATMRDLENQLESYRARVAQLEESLKQYPKSDQFRRDAIAHFASHPTEIPGLLSTLCPSEEAALPLFHMFRDDPVISKMLRRVAGWGYHKGKKGMQQNLYRTLEAALPDDWEEVRAVLPADLTPPGPEPFSKPSTSSIDPSATSSCNQDP